MSSLTKIDMSGSAEPKNFFYFSELNSFISIDRILSLGRDKGVFSKGFGFLCWFRHEHYLEPTTDVPLLFSIYSEGHGGFECYFSGTSLFYRTLSSERYIKLKPGEIKGIEIAADIEPEEWYLVYITHRQKKVGSKAKLNVSINRDAAYSFDCEYPDMDKVKELTHG